MKRDIIHMEVRKGSSTAEVVCPPGPLTRILATIFVVAVAVLVFSLVLIVGISIMLSVWLTILIVVAAAIVRSLFARRLRIGRHF